MQDDKAKHISEMDQASATLAETFPPLWRRLYENCIQEGFEKPEAFKLVCLYVLSNGNITLRP